MRKRFYDAGTMETILRDFERGYGMRSDDFYRAHVAGDAVIEHIPSMHRQVWAGFYTTWLRMSGRRMTEGGFAARVERELELA